MKHLDPNHVGLAVGTLTGLWHVAWGVLVALGLAQTYLDFILSVHFLSVPVTVNAFEPVKWLTLIAATFVLGYIGGYVFALVWNRIHK